jgi:hypothetical protein
MNTILIDSSRAVASVHNTFRTHQQQLTAAFTGAGSGLGEDIALGLAAKGYRVFGTKMSQGRSRTSKRRLAGPSL